MIVYSYDNQKYIFLRCNKYNYNLNVAKIRTKQVFIFIFLVFGC